MTTLYRTILRESWNITKQNRWLWFFGLFAALLGNGGIFNLLVKNINSVQNQGGVITDLNSIFNQGEIGALIQTLSEVLNNLDIVSILVFLVIAVLSIFILWLATVTQGGLISGTFRLYRQQSTNMKESWQRGVSKFWPVLWLNLSTSLATYILLVIVGLPFFFLYIKTSSLVWQWVFLMVSYVIFVPFAIVVAAVVQYAVIYVVIKNSEFTMSLKEGWNLFKKNWLVTIEIALALFVINALAGLVVLVGVVFILLPFLILGFLGLYFDILILFNIGLILGLIVLASVVFLFGAVFSVFQTATWVVLFNKLSEGVIISKFVRLAEKWINKNKSLPSNPSA